MLQTSLLNLAASSSALLALSTKVESFFNSHDKVRGRSFGKRKRKIHPLIVLKRMRLFFASSKALWFVILCIFDKTSLLRNWQREMRLSLSPFSSHHPRSFSSSLQQLLHKSTLIHSKSESEDSKLSIIKGIK